VENNNVRVVSFGCRLNTFEAEIIKKHVQKLGFPALIINSCGVTNEAERQLRQFIRREKKHNPEEKIILTGCASELKPEEYKKMPEVDYVIPSVAKFDEEVWYNLEILDSYVKDLDVILPPIIESFENRERAFVQIQNGCDQMCTYCATRLARGKSISFPKEHIIEQINAMSKNHKEIVLTGVNISSYNFEGKRLKHLISDILKETKVERLRLSSLDVADIDEEFIALFKEDRIMPHIHFSIQSGDNTVLKRMLRRHTKESALEVIEKIRKVRPEATFGADIIAGFPGETEEMFENSMDFVRKGRVAFLHAFPYSEKENTAAARMKEQVEVPIRKARAKELRDLSHKVMKEYLESRIGKTTNALIEGGFIARADDYSKIVFDGDAKIGSVQKLKILDLNRNNILLGELCSKD